jgi:hypothetical protein
MAASATWKLSAVWRALSRKATPSLVFVFVCLCVCVCVCSRTLLSSSSHPLEQPRPSGGPSRPHCSHPIHSPYRRPLHSIADQYIGLLFLEHFYVILALYITPVMSGLGNNTTRHRPVLQQVAASTTAK